MKHCDVHLKFPRRCMTLFNIFMCFCFCNEAVTSRCFIYLLFAMADGIQNTNFLPPEVCPSWGTEMLRDTWSSVFVCSLICDYSIWTCRKRLVLDTHIQPCKLYSEYIIVLNVPPQSFYWDSPPCGHNWQPLRQEGDIRDTDGDRERKMKTGHRQDTLRHE